MEGKEMRAINFKVEEKSIIVWCDVHMCATNEWHEAPPAAYKSENEFLIGDIVDFANCKKKDLISAKLIFSALQGTYGDKYLVGNHCLKSPGTRYLVINDRTVLAHGDYESWGEEKAEKYRSKEPGAGFIKRAFWVNFLESFERVWDRKFKDEFIDRATAVMDEYGCEHYVCGHLHPKKTVVINLPGLKKITILARGKNIVEL